MIRALTVVMIVLPVVMYYKACMQSPSGLLCTIGKKAQPTYGHSPLQFCIVYLDDILIFSFDRDSHTEHVRKVLERLQKA